VSVLQRMFAPNPRRTNGQLRASPMAQRASVVGRLLVYQRRLRHDWSYYDSQSLELARRCRQPEATCAVPEIERLVAEVPGRAEADPARSISQRLRRGPPRRGDSRGDRQLVRAGKLTRHDRTSKLLVDREELAAVAAKRERR